MKVAKISVPNFVFTDRTDNFVFRVEIHLVDIFTNDHFQFFEF